LLLSKRNQFFYVARPVTSACRAACCVTHRRLLRLTQTHHRLLHLRCASGCFGTSRGLLRDSSSTTSPRAGSSSTTSPPPRVRVPQHVARLITWLVVDYFDYAARPGASACCAARHAARRAARRRLLRLRRASGCLGTSRGSSSTTLTTPRVRVPRHVAQLATRLVVDYFTYAARPVASARRAACRVTHRRLLRLTQARLSRGSSSTTSPRAG
jgi:hypothetical protein